MPTKLPTKQTKSPRHAPARSKSILRVVGIGASAGGLEAFTELLQHLPADRDVAYVLVQHLDPTHPSLLTELLAKTTTLPVREITDRTLVEGGQVYVIPPNCDLSIQARVLQLAPRDKSAGPARSIDHFLQSLAADRQGAAVGVILSGAGSDGALGIKAIKEAGGITFAQDNDTAKYDSMPRSAVGTGCVDFVLPPAKIGGEIARLLARPGRTKRRAADNARARRNAPRSREAAAGGATRMAWPAAPEDADLRKIYLLLRTRTGTDFSLYRINTIRRRLARRMSLHKLKGLDAYARFLREHPAELDALYHDFLINVTSFFRNPGVFDTLKKKIFPRLVKNGARSDAIRVWVAGCSTGQEPYSLAMAYTEFAEQSGQHLPIQIFASDLNSSVLDLARSGRYTPAQVQGVSAARLQRFFTRENEFYRVQKSIRDMVIFAQQNLLTDPPFTRVDLISCRNLLIYLEPALQQKIIPAFHYALKTGGVLVLGTSESVGQFATLFEPFEKSQKIYFKKPATTFLRYERPPAVPLPRPRPAGPVNASVEFSALDAFREADRLTLAKYAPVSVLVAEDGEILQFRGDVQRYLELPAGKASFQLLKMARPGLALPLQRAFERAKRDHKIVRERGLRLDRRQGTVNLEIVPLKNLKARCFLVIFERGATKPKPELLLDGAPPRNGHGNGNGNGNGNGHDHNGNGRELTHLRQEYADTREHLATLQEQHDTSVEELQASNEEVQSANEELQSLNEELETSNEELESANEELTTLNEELATRNTELRESEQRLREQAQLLELAPVLVRSPKDRIIFWNRGAEKLYGFTKEEALGQTSHLFLGAQFPEPLEKIEKELHRRGQWDGEIFHRRKDGHVICVSSQWVLHHDVNNKVRAILEVNTDVTARRQAERALRDSEEFNRRVLESSPDSIKVLDLAGRIVFVSPAGVRLMEMRDAKACANAYWPDLWENGDRAEAERAYRAALSGETVRFRGLCFTVKRTPKWWDVVVQPVLGAAGRPEKLLVVKRDITAQRAADVAREDEARFAALRAEIALAVARNAETRPVLQEIVEILRRQLDAAAVHIWIAESGMLALRAASDLAAPPRRVPRALERIAAQREPHVINEAARELAGVGEADWLKRERIVAFAGLPIAFSDRATGIVGIYGRRPFEPRVVKELELSVDAIGQFIHRKAVETERSSLLQEAMAARAEVELLNETGRAIAAEIDLARLSQAVIEAATKLAKAEFGAFSYATAGPDGVTTHSALAGLSRETAAQLPRFDEPAATVNGAGAALAERLRVQSLLHVPVVSRAGETIGALLFGHSKPEAFGERERRLAANLAAQAGIAMDNARLVEELERKVVERTARLQETISELQAFSYTVSHDLRAPLRAMQSYAQVLLEDCASELSDSAKEYLSRIENAGVRLDRLIQDVLTYSRITRSQIATEPLDLEKLITDIMHQYPMLQPPAADIRIVGPLPRVQAEQSTTTQCLSNLLGNAVKFVPPGRKPHIVVRAERHDQRVRVWVEDNGIGIEPKDQERIFKMFERVNDSNRYEGTGIGLAIVRKAIERMGGQVGVESQPGAGSRFWLDFHPAEA
ncbi:MAG TPA: chemotaxis protein CheB [Opitutaceae bacterium]|nr:chemotaxis protein CheB [Opitutaceae bacterium]